MACRLSNRLRGHRQDTSSGSDECGSARLLRRASDSKPSQSSNAAPASRRSVAAEQTATALGFAHQLCILARRYTGVVLGDFRVEVVEARIDDLGALDRLRAGENIGGTSKDGWAGETTESVGSKPRVTTAVRGRRLSSNSFFSGIAPRVKCSPSYVRVSYPIEISVLIVRTLVELKM
jgi:hypothetical protein